LRGYSKQRFVLVVWHVICSAIGCHSNSWASCWFLVYTSDV